MFFIEIRFLIHCLSNNRRNFVSCVNEIDLCVFQSKEAGIRTLVALDEQGGKWWTRRWKSHFNPNYISISLITIIKQDIDEFNRTWNCENFSYTQSPTINIHQVELQSNPWNMNVPFRIYLFWRRSLTQVDSRRTSERKNKNRLCSKSELFRMMQRSFCDRKMEMNQKNCTQIVFQDFHIK